MVAERKKIASGDTSKEDAVIIKDLVKVRQSHVVFSKNAIVIIIIS